jgi:hypothetical protein
MPNVHLILLDVNALIHHNKLIVELFHWLICQEASLIGTFYNLKVTLRWRQNITPRRWYTPSTMGMRVHLLQLVM